MDAIGLIACKPIYPTCYSVWDEQPCALAVFMFEVVGNRFHGSLLGLSLNGNKIAA